MIKIVENINKVNESTDPIGLAKYAKSQLGKFQNNCEVASSGTIVQATHRGLAYYKKIDAELHIDTSRGIAKGSIKPTSKTTDTFAIEKVRLAGLGYMTALEGCSKTYPFSDESDLDYVIDNFIEMCNVASKASSPITYENGKAEVNDLDSVQKSILNISFISKSKGMSPFDIITNNSVYNSLADIDKQVLDLYDSYLGGTKVSPEVKSALQTLVDLDADFELKENGSGRESTSLRIKDYANLAEIYDGELFQTDSSTMDFAVVEGTDNKGNDVYAVLSKGLKDTGYSVIYTTDDYTDAVDTTKNLVSRTEVPSISTPVLNTDEVGTAIEPIEYDDYDVSDHAVDPSEVPNLIYHCTTGEGLVGILNSGRINSGSYMGDPMFANGVSFTTDKDYKLWDNSIFQLILDGKKLAKDYDLVEIHEEEYNDAFEVDESELRAITSEGVSISKYLVGIELAYEGIDFFRHQIENYLPDDYGVDNPASLKEIDPDSDEYDIANALIYLSNSKYNLGTQLSDLIDQYRDRGVNEDPSDEETTPEPEDEPVVPSITPEAVEHAIKFGKLPYKNIQTRGDKVTAVSSVRGYRTDLVVDLEDMVVVFNVTEDDDYVQSAESVFDKYGYQRGHKNVSFSDEASLTNALDAHYKSIMEGSLEGNKPEPVVEPEPSIENPDSEPSDPAVEYLLSKGLGEVSDDKFKTTLENHDIVIELGGTSVRCTISGDNLEGTTELSVDYYRFKLSRGELTKSARYGSNRDETIKGVYSEAMEIVRLASHSGDKSSAQSESDLRKIDMRVHNVSDPDEKDQLHRIVKVVKQFKDEIEADNMFNAFFLEEPKERKKYRLPTVGLGLCCYDKDIHSWGELKKSPLFKRLVKSRKIVRFRDWFRTIDPDGVKCWMYIWVDSEYAKENSEWLYESVGSMIEYDGSQYVISEVQDKSVILKNCNEMISIPKLELLTNILG